jgi:hypothetical protein
MGWKEIRDEKKIKGAEGTRKESREESREEKYRGYCLGPRTFWEDSISSSTESIHTKIFFYV